MSNIPYRAGYLVHQWRQVTAVLIMKDPKDHRVHRSRLIPLKEADTNENLKRMDKDAIVAIEVHSLLANE